MSGHIEEVFKILRDASTGAGVAPVARIEGDSGAAVEGIIGYSFKDSSGNVILPQLTSAGKIPVETGAVGVKKSADGQDVAGSTAAFQDVCAATLTVDVEYTNIVAHACASRTTLYRVTQLNDAAETVLAEFMVGPGCMSFRFDDPNIEFTAGSSGTQSLNLQGKNLFKVSVLSGNISCQAV